MAEPAPGMRIAARYRLVDQLGHGGMGTVWEAVDETLDRRVAVKLMRKELAQDPRALARFEREAKAVARLRSVHVVHVHDYGVEPSPFIVMELLEGRVLQTRISRRRQLPLEASARIVRQIARALTAAHAENIIHRDLKPSNVFLVRDEDDEFVKVYDFGVAKALIGARPRRLTSLGAIMGTPRYMSPEQLRGDDVDARTDVWSLGVIAFRLATGRHPFPGDGMAEVIQQILTADALQACAIDADLPPEIDAFFARALAKDRDHRFSSAHELARELGRIAGVSIASNVALPPASRRGRGIDDGLEPTTLLRQHRAGGRPRHLRAWSVLAAILFVAVGGIMAALLLRAPPPTSASSAESAPPFESSAAPGIPPKEPRSAKTADAAPSASTSAVAPARPTPPRAPRPPRKTGDDLFDTPF